jgi:GNAT superfamily N-acetyltransferase
MDQRSDQSTSSDNARNTYGRNKLQKTLNRFGSEHSLIASLLILEAIIFWLDVYTGPLVSFAPYYILPVATCTWFVERRAFAFLFIALSALARVSVHDQILMGHPMRSYLYIYEFFQSFLLYTIVEFLVRKVKLLFREIGNHSIALEHRLKIDQSIRRAVLEDIDDVIFLSTIGASDGGLSEDLLKHERQLAFIHAYKQAILDGALVRGFWEGGSASVPCELWVSEINGRVAGYFVILGIDNTKSSDRELEAIVVAREYRGFGIGTAMTDFFCMHYLHRRLVVACKPGSQMMHMVERRGFKPYAESPPYILFERK